MSHNLTLVDHFMVECQIAARDREAREITQAEAADRDAAAVLSQLDRTVAEADNRRSRIEQVRHRSHVLLDWMALHDWPGFHSGTVLVGFLRKPVWKGALGHRTIPVLEERAILTRLGIGITSRGELIESRPWQDQDLPENVIDLESNEFDLYGFETFFQAFFDHYGIDPNA